MDMPLRCFTAYDVRGRVPEELNAEIAARIALAFAEYYGVQRLVLGRDMRLSSPELAEAIIQDLLSEGVHIHDLGLCGTEEVYHAVFSGVSKGIDGGIMLTASHNPAEYNGMKIVGRGARPVSSTNGLREIAVRAADSSWYAQKKDKHKGKQKIPGAYLRQIDKDAYLQDLLRLSDVSSMRPLRLVVNSGNGCAGPVLDLLEPHLPFSFIRLQHEPDGAFPHGVPNPLLPEKRLLTSEAVREHQADMGIAWDGDFDRCFLYDEQGRFIEGYYIVGLLAGALLATNPGATILHDPRLIWNTQAVVKKAGGKTLMSRTGHAFIKENMRCFDALYGGEMSAHHYFRDFGYCDSGMLPWLLVCSLVSKSGRPLSRLCDDYLQAYPVSGEINTLIKAPAEVVFDAIEHHYHNGSIDKTDGLSIEYGNYRFNVRQSNTEPLLRLNVETKGDALLLQQKTEELLALIHTFS